MQAIEFYNNLEQKDKDILRERFLGGKAEIDLEVIDYIHLENMYDIINREGCVKHCGHDEYSDQEDIYKIHNTEECLED